MMGHPHKFMTFWIWVMNHNSHFGSHRTERTVTWWRSVVKHESHCAAKERERERETEREREREKERERKVHPSLSTHSQHPATRERKSFPLAPPHRSGTEQRLNSDVQGVCFLVWSRRAEPDSLCPDIAAHGITAGAAFFSRTALFESNTVSSDLPHEDVQGTDLQGLHQLCQALATRQHGLWLLELAIFWKNSEERASSPGGSTVTLPLTVQNCQRVRWYRIAPLENRGVVISGNEI